MASLGIEDLGIGDLGVVATVHWIQIHLAQQPHKKNVVEKKNRVYLMRS